MASFLDAILGMSGQERTEALRQFGRDLEYYVPPELRDRIGLLGKALEFTDAGDMIAAEEASRDLWNNPSVGSAANYAAAGLGLALPVVSSRMMQQGVDVTGDAISSIADDARSIWSRLNQPGPVPTMYSNPVMRLWHGSPYDFNEFDLSHVGKGEGAQDLGRGFSLTDEEAIAHLYTNPASRWGDLEAMRRYSEAGPGRYYAVDVTAGPEQFLDWGKPWRDQVPEGTPLYKKLSDEESRLLKTYGDDPAMVAAIPRAKLSNVWRDNSGLEDAASQSGFVGNLRKNFSGDTEYTVFDPAAMRIAEKFDKDGNPIPTLPAPRNEAEAMAKQVLEMRAAGRAGDVTEEMMAATDPQYMFANTPLPMDEASRMARARELGFGKGRYHGSNMDFQGFAGNVFTSDNPTVASTYNRGTLDAQIYPVMTRQGPLGDVTVEGGLSNWNQLRPDMIDDPAIARELDRGMPISTRDIERQAVIEGRSGVTFKDINDLGPGFNSQQFKNLGYTPEEAEALRRQYIDELSVPSEVDVRLSPNLVRSRFARFDPEFSHLRNLSAGVGGLGILSLLAQQDQEREEEIRQYLGGLL